LGNCNELDATNPGYIDDPRYLEFNEGKYNYRLTGFDEFGNEVGTVDAWEYVEINYDYLNLEDPTDIHYLEGNSNIYDQSVNLWWSAQGVFDKYLIEKSIDNENWEIVTYLPRMATYYYYNEDTDGNYYYRVSAVDSNTGVKDTEKLVYTIRVKNDALISNIDGWYDWNTSEISLNWEFLSDDIHTVRLERIESLETEYTLINEFGNLTKNYNDEVVISGTYIYKLSVLDEFGVVLDFVESKEFYIEAPQHLYHLNAYFNQGSGEVRFDFGFNEFKIDSYKIYKSDDGGLIWVEVLDNNVLLNVDNYGIYTAKYNEFTEGTYVYKMIGYDINDNVIGEVLSWYEVSVRYDNLNLDEPIEIHHVDASVNIYNQEVSIWWGSQGPYESHLIERSSDQVNWETIATVVRLVTSYHYIETVDGEYYYRVSALDANDAVEHSNETMYDVRVKEDALIQYFNVWYDQWNEEMYLNWDIINNDLAKIRVERKLVGDLDFTLVGEYGPLKRLLYDDELPNGEYIYHLVLLDELGNILDEITSNDILVEENTN